MDIITALYEKYLLRQIAKAPHNLPEHLTLVLSESDVLHPDGISKLKFFVLWCNKLGIKIISIYVDILDTDESLKKEMVLQLTDKLHDVFSKMPKEIGFEIYGEDGEQKKKRAGSGLLVHLSIGFGGRSEITKAVKSILSDVKSGKLKPDDINENVIESSLLVTHEPDIVIRAGGKHLSDFLIWQSVYSELYFTDVNWHDVRKIEMLRIVRDFQKRQRRFGK